MNNVELIERAKYTGLYIQKDELGTIFNVQVEDRGGNEIGLILSEYQSRMIKPDAYQLPTKEEYWSKI